MQLLGPREKPKYCIKNCPRQATATGFVPDDIPPNPKVLVLKYQPSDDEINYRQAITTDWLEFAEYSGLTPQDIGVCYMFRCFGNPKEHKKDLIKSQKSCRNWDSKSNSGIGKAIKGGLLDFAPDTFIVTFDTANLKKAAAFKVFFRRAFQLAKEFSDKGLKPMILCGMEVTELVNPELFSTQNYDREITFRSWVGHWWSGSWPFSFNVFQKQTNKNLIKIEAEAKAKLRGL